MSCLERRSELTSDTTSGASQRRRTEAGPILAIDGLDPVLDRVAAIGLTESL